MLDAETTVLTCTASGKATTQNSQLPRGLVEIPDLAVADTILGWALKTGGLSFYLYHNHEMVISC